MSKLSWKKMSNKKKYWIMQAVSIIVILTPIIVFASVSGGSLTGKQWLGLTMSGLIILSLVLLALMIKVKIRAGVWLLMTACVMLVLQNLGYILGMGLLMVGLGLTIDAYLIRPLILKYKRGMLKDNGETVTFSQRID